MPWDYYIQSVSLTAMDHMDRVAVGQHSPSRNIGGNVRGTVLGKNFFVTLHRF